MTNVPISYGQFLIVGNYQSFGTCPKFVLSRSCFERHTHTHTHTHTRRHGVGCGYLAVLTSQLFRQPASVVSFFYWELGRGLESIFNLKPKRETPRKSLCFGCSSAKIERSRAFHRKEGNRQRPLRFILKAGGNYCGEKIVSVERPGLYDTARKNKHALNKTLVHKNI
jgi:hypothetical protein